MFEANVCENGEVRTVRDDSATIVVHQLIRRCCDGAAVSSVRDETGKIVVSSHAFAEYLTEASHASVGMSSRPIVRDTRDAESHSRSVQSA